MWTETQYRQRMRMLTRAGARLVCAVRRDPRVVGGAHREMSGIKPVGLAQWLVDSREMCDQVDKVYPTINPGQVKQLMTATGAGKTTQLPVHIANKFGHNVVVLVPNVVIAAHVCEYVARSHTCVSLLKPLNMRAEAATGGHVWYSTVADFLALYASDADVFEHTRMDCIVVDESHEIMPEYIVFRYLVAANKFGSTRVLYSSATAASDISMETTGRKRLLRVEGRKMPTTPVGLPIDSPLAHSSVTNRCLMFLPFDTAFPAWESYYLQHDVPTFTFGYGDGSARFAELEKFLRNNKLCVVLTTAVLQTGVTLPVDTVMDCGMTVRLATDFGAARVSLVVEPATVSDQVQRAGRIGRTHSGTAYVANVANTPVRGLDDPDIASRVYMWLRVFSLRVNDPVVSTFEAAFPGLEVSMFAVLLTMTLPAFYLRPFICDGKAFYGDFVDNLSNFSTIEDLPRASANSPDVGKWHTAAMEMFEEGVEEEYLYRVALPAEWSLAAFHCFSGFAGDGGDGASGILTVNDMNEKSSMRRRSAVIGRSQVSRRGSAHSRVQSVFDKPIRLPGRRQEPLQSVDEETESSASSENRSPSPESTRSVSPERSRRTQSLAEVMDVPLPVRNRRVSFEGRGDSAVKEWSRGVARSSSSSGSVVIPQLHLREVKASKHAREFMYPMNEDLRAEYLNSLASSATDRRRCAKLLSGEKQFGRLSTHSASLREKQQAAFLSVLREHRAAVTSALQAAVSRPTVRSVVSVSRRMRQNDYETMSIRLASLLDICAKEYFKVGVDKSKDHSSAGGGDHCNYSYVELANIGAIVLKYTPLLFSEAIGVLQEQHVRVRAADGITIANAWYLGAGLYAPTHAVQGMSPEVIRRWADVDVDASTDEDVVVAVIPDSYRVLLSRQGIDGEYVSLVAVFPGTVDVAVYGNHKLFPYMGGFVFQGVYPPGTSGALLVAHNDGAIVGMYMGLQCELSGFQWSRVVSMHNTII